LEALINLGSVLGDLGRWTEAKATYRLAVQIHPNSGVALNVLGRSLSRLTEDDEEAERCLEQAIALNAHDNNTFVELGNILMRKLQTDASHGVPIRRKLTFRRCFLILRLPARDPSHLSGWQSLLRSSFPLCDTGDNGRFGSSSRQGGRYLQYDMQCR
jgi:tetratricopeptide (TPR) repeat protein